MINDTLSEEAFRSDKAAVVDTQAFFNSPSGQKFIRALRGSHPLRIGLVGKTKRTTAGIREGSLVENVNPQGILGNITGYEMCLDLIDALSTPWREEDDRKPVESQRAKVARVLSMPPAVDPPDAKPATPPQA